VVQVGYVVPIWRLLVRKGKLRTAKGMVIGASVTLLINAAVVALIRS
jgi:hypothetical protein